MERIHYLGPIGSYSSIAARKYQEKVAGIQKIIAEPTISTIFQQLQTTDDYGLVPLENTTSGDVYETYKNLYTHAVEIMGVVVLPITHALIAKVGTDFTTIDTVLSHPQALQQVSNFSTLHGLIEVPTISTMDACLQIAESAAQNVGAIASAAAIIDDPRLCVITDGINNNLANFTRFLLIKRKPEGIDAAFTCQENGTALFALFELKADAVGGLSEVLAVLAKHNINLNNIKSRPIEGAKFAYFFIIEAAIDRKVCTDHHAIYQQLQAVAQILSYSIY